MEHVKHHADKKHQNEIRLKVFCELLASIELYVAEIAYNCSFNDRYTTAIALRKGTDSRHRLPQRGVGGVVYKRTERMGILAHTFGFSLSYTVFFDNIVHILVASAREVDEYRALTHFFRQLHTVSDSVRAFDGGNDTLVS